MKIHRIKRLSRRYLYMSRLLSNLSANQLSQFIFAKCIEGPDTLSKKVNNEYRDTFEHFRSDNTRKPRIIQMILSRKPNRFRFDKYNGKYNLIHRSPDDMTDIIYPDEVEWGDNMSEYIDLIIFKKGAR